MTAPLPPEERRTPAEVLKAAADMARALAAEAPHGPWTWTVSDVPARHQRVTNGAAVVIAECSENPDFPAVMAEHISRWNPAVTAWIAKLWEDEAHDLAGYAPSAQHTIVNAEDAYAYAAAVEFLRGGTDG